MSKEILNEAAIYPGPISANGDVLVLASQTTARAATQLVDPASEEMAYWELHADFVDAYITIGDANVAAPGPLDTSGDTRCIKIEAGTSRQFVFCRGRSHFRDLESDTNGFLRCYKASTGQPISYARTG